MSTPVAPSVRGACPGALRPMQSGDGLIVRVRPHAGVLGFDQARAVAKAAADFGNGEIDLTQRANLQLRGITSENLDRVQDALARAGLLDATPEAEVIRNIVVSPFAPHVVGDRDFGPRFVAREIEQMLEANEVLSGLSPKFGFLVDTAEGDLDGVSGDIIVRALDDDTYALGVAGPQDVRWLGAAEERTMASHAIAAAKAYLALAGAGSRLRLKSAPGTMVAEIREHLSLGPLATTPSTKPRRPRLGKVRGLVGIGLPFGRVSANALEEIIDDAGAFNARHLRIAPWRAIYFECFDLDAADTLLSMFEHQGLITHDADPFAAIDACPGAPACSCAHGDTREAARKVASLFAKLGVTSAHVSGCAKGCARGTKADLVLVGEASGFGLIRNGTAGDAPQAHVNTALDGLTEALHG